MMISVVCGIIFSNNKVLICRRKNGKLMSGYWEFPGGKIGDREMPNNALRRELREELGMEVHLKNHFQTVVHHYQDFSVKLYAIKCILIEASYIMTEHDSIQWVQVEDLLNWKLSSADIPIAMKLIDEKQALSE